MNPLRVLLLIVAGYCQLQFTPLFADDSGFVSPYGPTQQFSADLIITTDKGQTINQKMYSDSGKIRTDISQQGMQIIAIVRPDLKKVYSIMVAQKMIMEMPYDAEKYKQQMPAASGPNDKVVLVGPDTVDGVACLKYKATPDKGKEMFWWVDASTKAPVKMMMADNSVTMLWKNYKAGPQDPSLFEPPTGYQVMDMPAAPAGQ